MKRQLSSLLVLSTAIIVVACMDGSRSGAGLTGPTSTARLESLPPDSPPVDSLPPDSLPPDSLPPDSLPPDSLPPDSLSPPDSLGAPQALMARPAALKQAVRKASDHSLVLLLKGKR